MHQLKDAEQLLIRMNERSAYRSICMTGNIFRGTRNALRSALFLFLIFMILFIKSIPGFTFPVE